MMTLAAVAALELMASQKPALAALLGSGEALTLLYLVAIGAVCACAIAHRGGAFSSAMYMIALAVGVSHLARHAGLYSELAVGDVEGAALALSAGLLMPVILAASPMVAALPIARGWARGWL